MESSSGRSGTPARQCLADRRTPGAAGRPASNAAARGEQARESDLVLYEDAIIHLLYNRYYPKFVENSPDKGWNFYRDFLADWQHFYPEQIAFPSHHEPAHTFACFRQIQRAFEQIFRDIIGGSLPAARLRAAIWQSIFTHDMRRYRRTLYARMGDFATLITGPSGPARNWPRAPSRNRAMFLSTTAS